MRTCDWCQDKYDPADAVISIEAYGRKVDFCWPCYDSSSVHKFLVEVKEAATNKLQEDARRSSTPEEVINGYVRALDDIKKLERETRERLNALSIGKIG